MFFPGEMLSKRSIQGASVAFFLNYMIDEAELQSILEITNKKNHSFPYWYHVRSRVHWMIYLTLKPKPSLGLLPRSFHVWQRLLEYPRCLLVAILM